MRRGGHWCYGARSVDLTRRSPDEQERQEADDLLGLLTPVIKSCLTDKGFAAAVAAQQVFGGHGYIREQGMEQFVRDARITQIYEGTNGVQAMDLVGRKLPRDNGRAVRYFCIGRWRHRRGQSGGRPRGGGGRAGARARRPPGGNHVAGAERHGRPL